MSHEASQSIRQPGGIQFRRDEAGGWRVIGPVEVLVPGEVVDVLTRSGETRRFRVGRVSKPFKDDATGEMVAFAWRQEHEETEPEKMVEAHEPAVEEEVAAQASETVTASEGEEAQEHVIVATGERVPQDGLVGELFFAREVIDRAIERLSPPGMGR